MRFLMMIVTVKLPMCIVIRMVSPPLGKCGQPPAVVVQRLAAEAALPVYHDSTGFARIALIYKIYKKRPEPKFWSLLVRKMGLSRGLTNSPLDCWFRHFGAVALFRLAVPESGCASCAACLLRPPRLLWLPVSAAGGGRLCSKSSAPNTKQKSPWRGTPWGPLFGAEDGT